MTELNEKQFRQNVFDKEVRDLMRGSKTDDASVMTDESSQEEPSLINALEEDYYEKLVEYCASVILIAYKSGKELGVTDQIKKVLKSMYGNELYIRLIDDIYERSLSLMREYTNQSDAEIGSIIDRQRSRIGNVIGKTFNFGFQSQEEILEQERILPHQIPQTKLPVIPVVDTREDNSEKGEETNIENLENEVLQEVLDRAEMISTFHCKKTGYTGLKTSTIRSYGATEEARIIEGGGDVFRHLWWAESQAFDGGNFQSGSWGTGAIGEIKRIDNGVVEAISFNRMNIRDTKSISREVPVGGLFSRGKTKIVTERVTGPPRQLLYSEVVDGGEEEPAYQMFYTTIMASSDGRIAPSAFAVYMPETLARKCFDIINVNPYFAGRIIRELGIKKMNLDRKDIESRRNWGAKGKVYMVPFDHFKGAKIGGPFKFHPEWVREL